MKYYCVLALASLVVLAGCVTPAPEEKQATLAVGDSLALGKYSISLDEVGSTGLATGVSLRVSVGATEERGTVLEGRAASFLGGELVIRVSALSPVSADITAYTGAKAKAQLATPASALSIQGNQTSVLRTGQTATCGESTVTLVSAAKGVDYSAVLQASSAGSSQTFTLTKSSPTARALNDTLALSLRNAIEGMAVVKVDCFRKQVALPPVPPPQPNVSRAQREAKSGEMFLHLGSSPQTIGDFTLKLVSVFSSSGSNRVTLQASDVVTGTTVNQTAPGTGTMVFFGGDLLVAVQNVVLSTYASPSSVKLFITQTTAPAIIRRIQSGNVTTVLKHGEVQKCGNIETSVASAYTLSGKVKAVIRVSDNSTSLIPEPVDVTLGVDDSTSLASGTYQVNVLSATSSTNGEADEAQLGISCGGTPAETRLTVGNKLSCSTYSVELSEVKQLLFGPRSKVTVSSGEQQVEGYLYEYDVFAPFAGDVLVRARDAKPDAASALVSLSCGLRIGDLSKVTLNVGEVLDCGDFLVNMTSINTQTGSEPAVNFNVHRKIDKSIDSKSVTRGEFRQYWGDQVNIWVDTVRTGAFENSADLRYKCQSV